MERLSEQIVSGLPSGWRPIGITQPLPDHTSILHAATDGQHKLVFLLVDGPVRSAMPLFEFNASLRKSGICTIWLFRGKGIPSTAHMLCALVEWKGGLPVVAIINSTPPLTSPSQRVSISDFTRAATEQRLKALGFAAGQFVDVTVTADECRCTECGTVEHKLEQATFHPFGEPHSPGLALTKGNLGRSVSKLIENAIRERREPNETLCSSCALPTTRANGHKVTKSLAQIQLSNLSALELIRFHKTAWYIA